MIFFGKFLFKVIGMSEKADFTVQVINSSGLNWESIIVGALTILGSFLIASYAANKALKNSYSKAWWDKKSDAYFDCISFVDAFIDRLIMLKPSTISGNGYDGEEIQAIWASVDQDSYGVHIITRHCYRHSALISKNAVSIIRSKLTSGLVRAAQNQAMIDLDQVLQININEVNEIKRKLLIEMRRDLKINEVSLLQRIMSQYEQDMDQFK